MAGAAVLLDTPGLTLQPVALAAGVLSASGRTFPVVMHPVFYAFQASEYHGTDVVHIDPIWTWLAETIDPGDAELTVTRDLGFPEGTFELVIGREVVTATNSGGLTWAIVRNGRGTTAERHLKGAMVSALPHTIVVTDGSTTWDYTARWGYPTAFSVSYSCPGGPSQATWTVQDYGATGPATLTAAPRLGSSAIISDSYGAYWIGIVDEVYPDFRVNGATVQIIARGWAVTATDQRYANSKVFGPSPVIENGHFLYTNFAIGLDGSIPPKPVYLPLYNPLQAVHTICDLARQDLTPFIAAGDYRGGDTALPSPTGNMIGKSAQEIWNEQTGHGEGDGTPVYWFVRGSAGDPTSPQLDIIDRPSGSTLTVPVASLQRAPLRWRRSDVQNQVLLRYAGGLASASETDGIADLDGDIRMRWIDASTQIGDGYLADQTVRTIVNSTGRVYPSAETLTIAYPKMLFDNDANPFPWWRDMAGQVIVVDGIDSGNVHLRGITEGFLIKENSFAFDTRIATIQTERVLILGDSVGRYMRAEEGRWGSALHNPDPINLQPGSGSDPRSSEGRDGMKGVATGQGQPAPGGGGKPDAVPWIPHLRLPPGNDSISVPGGFGDGVSPDSMAPDQHKEIQLAWPTRFWSGILMLDADGTVEVDVGLYEPGAGTVTPLFTISTAAARHSDHLVVVAAGHSLPEELLFEAGAAFQFKLAATDGVASSASVTLYGSKLEGTADIPAGSAPGSITVDISPGSPNGVVTVDLDQPSFVHFNYGPEDIGADDNGLYPSSLPSVGFAKHHLLTSLPALGAGTYNWQLFAANVHGDRSTVSGAFTV